MGQEREKTEEEEAIGIGQKRGRSDSVTVEETSATEEKGGIRADSSSLFDAVLGHGYVAGYAAGFEDGREPPEALEAEVAEQRRQAEAEAATKRKADEGGLEQPEKRPAAAVEEEDQELAQQIASVLSAEVVDSEGPAGKRLKAAPAAGEPTMGYSLWGASLLVHRDFLMFFT